MSLYIKDTNRRLVPRWRSWDVARAGDIMTRVAKDVKGQSFGSGNSFFDQKLAEFNNNPSVATASELLVASIVCGAESQGEKAAEYLRKRSTHTTDAIRSLLDIPHPNVDNGLLLESATNFLSSTKALYKDIHRLRIETHNTPRNAFAWVNLARAYLLVGESDKTKHCLRVAVRLAPENRYVLRCASRFLVHISQPIEALRLLRQSSRTSHDPWLMAAEIAAAQIAGVGSRTARRAKNLLRDADDPRNLTELAGSFATLQLYSGNTKGATKNFRFSLIEPTENAVAQAEWASQQIPGIRPDDTQLGISRGYEARAASAYKAGEIDKSLDCLAKWAMDEPYSTRPFINGSYLACIATLDFDQASRFCEFGLLANGDDSTLLNNNAVALALSGNVAKAQGFFDRAIASRSNELPEHIKLATEGLLLFRSGEPEVGRSKYRDSISKAPDIYKPLIAMHLAQEEMNADTGFRRDAWELVYSHARPKDRPEIMLFAKNLGQDIEDWT